MAFLLVTCDHEVFSAAAFAVAQLLSAEGIDYSFLVRPETPFFSRAAVRAAVAAGLGIPPDDVLLEEV